MQKIVYIKTSRTARGYAAGTLSKYLSSKPNSNKWVYHYAFKHYKDYKFFNTYKELKDYVESKYSLIVVWDNNKEYHMPEEERLFFN